MLVSFLCFCLSRSRMPLSSRRQHHRCSSLLVPLRLGTDDLFLFYDYLPHTVSTMSSPKKVEMPVPVAAAHHLLQGLLSSHVMWLRRQKTHAIVTCASFFQSWVVDTGTLSSKSHLLHPSTFSLFHRLDLFCVPFWSGAGYMGGGIRRPVRWWSDQRFASVTQGVQTFQVPKDLPWFPPSCQSSKCTRWLGCRAR